MKFNNDPIEKRRFFIFLVASLSVYAALAIFVLTQAS